MACQHKPTIKTVFFSDNNGSTTFDGRRRRFVCRRCGNRIKLRKKSCKIYEAMTAIQAGCIGIAFLFVLASTDHRIVAYLYSSLVGFALFLLAASGIYLTWFAKYVIQQKTTDLLSDEAQQFYPK